jgi:predicted enzyme related to lactoylglutathione lyase
MGKVVHFEIPADDPARALAFYGKVFGWTAHKWDGPIDYWLLQTGPDEAPGICGGLMARSKPDEIVVNTIGVESVDDALNSIVAEGGTIVSPKHAIPGVGWMAYFKDPDGNGFGIMQSDPSAK